MLYSRFNGDDGMGRQNSKGEYVTFSFDVQEYHVGSKNALKWGDLGAVAQKNGISSSEKASIDKSGLVDKYGMLKSPAMILTGGDLFEKPNALGVNNQVRTKMKEGYEFDSDRVGHEVTHQFMTRAKEDYSGGIMNNPPQNFTKQNIDWMLNDSYKK